ncbi:ribosomal L1 domain-containing protein [Acrasis kona]|uniref:Ribosomal L1 domain-containing protein n=1 Tax=Acrasis kona TaxID=1008807 RepID=A0AAW2ZDL3_9EUKA
MADTTTALHSEQLKKLFATTSKEVRDEKLGQQREKYLTYQNSITELKNKLKETVRKNNGTNYKSIASALETIQPPADIIGQLDINACIKEYIASECVEDGLYFVDCNDPDLLRVKGVTPQAELIMKQKNHQNRKRKDEEQTIPEEQEDDDEDDLEFLNPKKLNKQEALQVFTGKNRVAKQFEFIASSMDKILNEVKQRTVVGQETSEKFKLKVDKNSIKEAVEQIIIFENARMKGDEEVAAKTGKRNKLNRAATELQTKFLISPSFFLYASVHFAKKSSTGAKSFYLPVLKPFYEADETSICVIVRDDQKEDYKKELGDQYPLLKVMKVSKFHTAIETYPKKHLLANSYDLFFADASIQRSVLEHFGKAVVRRKKTPAPVILEEVNDRINNALNGARIQLSVSQPSVDVKIARLSWSVSDIVKNIVYLVENTLARVVPFGTNNAVTKISLRTTSSPSLPIYIIDDKEYLKLVPTTKTFKEELKYNKLHGNVEEEEEQVEQAAEEVEEEQPEQEEQVQPAKKKRTSKAKKEKESAAEGEKIEVKALQPAKKNTSENVDEMKIDEPSKKRKRGKEIPSKKNEKVAKKTKTNK